MKKIITVLLFCCAITLFSCDYQIHTKQQQLFEVSTLDDDSQLILLSGSGEDHPPRKKQLVNYYSACAHHKDYYLYEAYIDDTDITYLGIYMDNRTIKKMNSLKRKYMSLGTEFRKYDIQELGYYFLCYCNVCSEPEFHFDKKDYPLYYHEFDTPEIPLENGEYRLVNIYTRAKVTFQRINDGETYTSSFYLYTHGSIIDNYYVVDISDVLPKDVLFYLYATNEIESGYQMGHIRYFFISIKTYNDTKSIYEYYEYVDNCYEYGAESYREFIDVAIIKKPNLDLHPRDDDDHCYIYDYDKVKEIFMKEFYN